ncbi:MAG: cation diffusion facilitator family transporter [Phycisphaerales bacterium]
MSSPARTQRVALIGLAVNLAMAVFKLLAGVVGHSYALIADAIESIADIVGSVVIWGGLHVSSKPADSDHPYGHGKAESLAALVVAVLIALAGVMIGVKAVEQILTPHQLPAWWTLAVLLGVVVTKESMSRYARRVAREGGGSSTAMNVEAGHHRADVITSAAAFIGISVALLGSRLSGGNSGSGGGIRWECADDYAAVLASAIIIYNGIHLARLPLRELMDAEPTEALEAAQGDAHGGGRDGHREVPRTHQRVAPYIELHVEVAPDMSVADAHVITGKIKTAVRAAVPAVADIHIHVEPHRPAAASTGAEPSATPASSAQTGLTTDIHPNT